MSRKGYLIPLAVLVIGVLVRVLFTLQVRDMPFYYHPVLDSGFFHQWAKFKIDATWVDGALPFRESGYAFFLAALYRVFGESFTAVRLVQAVLGGLTSLLVYRIGATLFNRAAGAVAGVIFSLMSLAIFFTGELNETTLLVFLVVLSSYLLLRASKGGNLLLCLLSGLILGAAFLTKFTAIAALIAWALQLLFEGKPRLRAGALLVIVGFIVIPVGYNALFLKAEDTAVLPTRVGWQAFLASSATGGAAKEPHYVITLEAQGGAARAYAEADLTDGERDAVRFARIDGGEALGRKASGRYWQDRTLDEFFGSPSAFLAHYAHKLGLVWGPSLPSSNVDSRFMARYSILLRNLLFAFAGLATVGIVGTLVFTRRGSSSILMFMILYSLVAADLLVSDGDKMLLVPFLAVFGGHLLVEIVSGFRRMKLLRSAALVAAAIVVGIIVSRLPSVPVNEARHHMILGDIYSNESLFDRAEESYNRAIEADPDYSLARLSLAKLFATTGKADLALETLAEATRRDPENPKLRIEKASLLTYVQRPGEALDELAAVERAYPYEPRLHQFRGLAFMGLNEPEAAARELELEIEYVGGDFVTYSALGRARFELAQYEEAAAALETALQSNPYSAPTVMQLADSYTMLERHENAAEILARVVTVDPGNVRLRFKLGNALYRAGRYNESLKNFKEISKFDPRNTDILLNMGVVYAEMDSLDQAIEVWERVLTLDPGNETARDNLRRARE
jgi:tetratricopeptide (TPR) repeat protein